MRINRLMVWVLALSLFQLLAQDASAFYIAKTGCWPNRDPIGEPGFELVANRSEDKAKTQEVVHFQKGLAELMMANPALAMRIQNQLAKLEKSSNTKADPSAGNLYMFVQNDPISKIDVSGLDIWYVYCIMNCPCRPMVGAVSGWTLWDPSLVQGRCCKATERFFCASASGGGFAGYAAALEAASIFFQGCLLTTH